MVDSPGISNANLSAQPRDELGASLPNLGGIASVVHRLVQEGLTIDQAAEKVARWVDPSLVPALETLAKVLEAVNKFLPGSSASEHGGE